MQDLPAHQPRRRRPTEQHHRQHHRGDAGLARLHPGDHPDEDHEQQEGQGDDEIGEAHQRLVDPAAEEAGGGAVGHPEGDEDQGCRQADEQGHPRPRHQPGQHVPAQVVRAQGMGLQLDLIPRRQRLPFCDQAHRLGFLHGDDPPHFGLQGLEGVGQPPLAVQGHHGVEVGLRPQVQAVFKVALGGV